MFLHSGASLHGHEYSNRTPSSSLHSGATNSRGPLLRSAFAPPKQRLHAVDGTPALAARQRPASDYLPRDRSPSVRFQEPHDEPPPTPATNDESVSESDLSDAGLSIDGAVAAPSARRKRSRRARRSSTTYSLGYPTPRIIGKTKVVQKVLLPRLLLQLQKVSADGRPHPVLEMFPASRIAGPLVAPRMGKRFPDIFGVKRHLGYDDIVLVKRDDDSASDQADSDSEDSLERRNLVAVYSPLRHSDEAEIVLDDGSVWVAKPLANGSYNFVHTDAEGNTTTARWARRHAAAVTPTSVSTEAWTPSAAAPPTRYTFSIINPLTRRHPVMATLTPSSLDVQDAYTSVSASHSRHPPIARAGRPLPLTSSSSPSLARATPNSPSKLSSLGSRTDCESDSAVGIPSSPDLESAQRTVHQVDDATKMLISVTALWVALRSGWSQSHTPSSNRNNNNQDDSAATSTTVCPRSDRSRRNTWTRSSTSDSPRPRLSSDTGEDATAGGRGFLKRHSMPARPPDRRATYPSAPLALYSSSASTASRSSTPVEAVPNNRDAAAAAKPPPDCRRAASTGAAFMHRRLRASSSSSSASPANPSAAAAAAAAAAAPAADAGSGEGLVDRASKLGRVPPSPTRQQQLQQQQQKKTSPVQSPVCSSGAQGAAARDNRARGRRRSAGAFDRGGGASRDSSAPPREKKRNGTAAAPGGTTKNGLRSRLAKWVRKIASSSSSSSSR